MGENAEVLFARAEMGEDIAARVVLGYVEAVFTIECGGLAQGVVTFAAERHTGPGGGAHRGHAAQPDEIARHIVPMGAHILEDRFIMRGVHGQKSFL